MRLGISGYSILMDSNWEMFTFATMEQVLFTELYATRYSQQPTNFTSTRLEMVKQQDLRCSNLSQEIV